MPSTDVLERLKAGRVTRGTEVIVLTADAGGRHQTVRQLGVIDYLTKSIDVPRFLETIANSLPEA